MSAEEFVRQYIAGTAKLTDAYGYDPAEGHDACGVGLVAALDGKPRRDVVHGGHRRAEGGVASRRGRCRRQDRRRRRHPCRDPAGLLPRRMSANAGERAARPAASPSAWCSCRAPTSARRSAAAPSSRREILSFGYRIYGWRQVPVDISVHRREGQRDAARDRADHDRQRRPERRRGASSRRDLYVIRRRIEKAAIAEQHQRVLHLLAVLPLDHLQGHVPRRAADGLLSRPARRALRLALRDLSTSAIRPTPSRPGSWRSRSACSPITARSTRSRATSTG